MMKYFNKPFSIAFALLACLTVSLYFPSESGAARVKKKIKRRYHLSAKSAILINATKQSRLFSKNAQGTILPASTTKVMTALIVLEQLSLDKVVTVSQNATNVQPSKAGLLAGENYTVSDLLYATLMQSANDASIVLAEAVAGSEREFTELMNKRARQLGARHTKFANSSGLPTKETQYSTAYDMSLILKEALKYPVFRDILNNRYKNIISQSGRIIALKNHNKLLFKNWKKDICGKTGYTRRAQQCFLGYVNNGKNTFIIGVFGCHKRWLDIRYILVKYGGMRL